MNQEITNILEQSEKIIWQEWINKNVLLFFLISSLIAITAISTIIFSNKTIIFNASNITLTSYQISIIIFLLGSIISIIKFFSKYVQLYTITNKRLILKSGLIWTDFNSIYFTEIKSINVNVWLIDKIFWTWTINIDTGKTETIVSGTNEHRSTKIQTVYDKFLYINNPYEIYKQIQTTLSSRQESLYSGRADKENEKN